MKKKNYSYIGISFIVLVFGIWVAIQIQDRYGQPDLVIVGERTVPEFELTNQHGETISNKDLEGKVYVVEFFFTSCPDICPIMNENMLIIQREFFGNPNVAIVSITIDPAHDTPEVLKAYAAQHNITKKDWHLLTGNRDEIFKLANDGFNLYVAEAPEDRGGFEHSGFFALIDKEGFIRSRTDKQGNPYIYYDGLESKQVHELKEDINKLL